MDRLDELAIFVRIVEEGSLVRAARRLRRSPPSVTRALAALEQRMRTRLIERTTRRLAPTEAGRAFLDRARAVLAEYERLAPEPRDAPVRGVLRVTAPVQFGRRHVAPVVLRFLDRFPETEVELRLADRNLDLIEEEIDVAVRIGNLSDSGMTVRPVGEVRRLWVASPRYLERRGLPGTPAELAGHDILLGTSFATQQWVFAGRRSSSLRLKGRLRVDDVETRLRATKAGRGIAQFLSYQVADDLAAGTLVRLLRPFEAPPLPVQIVTLGRENRAAKVEAFVGFLTRQLTALPVIHS